MADANLLGMDLDLIDPKSSQESISKACVKAWFEMGPNGRHNYGDCNGFVKSVQKELMLRPFVGDANAIYDEVETRPDWDTIGIGSSAAPVAGRVANSGLFTVAVWKNPVAGKHGHIAVITAYFKFVGIKPEHHAIGAWGQVDAVGQVMGKMSDSFGSGKHAAIKYANCRIRPF